MLLAIQIAMGIAALYQTVAFAACLRRLFFRERTSNFTPAVSILKPIRGADDDFYDAIRSHAELDYPEFEILFGLADPNDAARPHVERLIREYPRVPIRIVEVTTITPNGKAGAMIDMARESRHPIVLVNDSDIRVDRDYLRKVVAPLEDPCVGLVTCLYRALGHSFAGTFEALGVDTDFAPSTLVAPFVGVDEFALGSTLAVRRADLARIGGFESISSFIADDYQLGHRIHALGLKCYMAEPVVETHLGARDLRDVWLHQIRWARTIRLSRFGGYLGLPATFATLWAVAGLFSGLWWQAAVLLGLRLAVAVVAGKGVLRGSIALTYLWLVPFRDLFGVVVWAFGLAGNRVHWRDFWMRLDSSGRIVESGRASGRL